MSWAAGTGIVFGPPEIAYTDACERPHAYYSEGSHIASTSSHTHEQIAEAGNVKPWLKALEKK
jgi:hypothetical protein